jgi:3-oxosteroid 1-dehydrogenase
VSNWDHETDFLVIGSGGGGMTGAVVAHDCGAKTLVIEKSAVYGGTTALSGGVIWVPNNHHMPDVNIPDSSEEAYTYLKEVTGGEVDETRLKAYIERAPEMLQYMEDHGSTVFEAAPEYMDYYPELEGGKPGSRSIDPQPFSRRKLGDEGGTQRQPKQGGVFNISITAKEAHYLLDFTWKTYLWLAKRIFLYWIDIRTRLKTKQDNRMTLGRGLVGMLRYAMKRRNIDLWLNTPFRHYVVEEGRVVGVLAEKDGREIRIKANKGVLLAAGGFAGNTEMRQEHQQGPISNEWTAANQDNTGDGIRAGQAIGAATEFMHCAWWTPSYKIPNGDAEALIIGKSMPGSMFVNKAGRRFVNEAAPYEDVVKGQYASQATGVDSVPAFMVFDGRFRASYPCGPIGPSTAQPDSMIPKRYQGFLKKADTLEELAAILGIDAKGLVDEVDKNNRFAESGIDEDFGRGSSLHDRYYSDPKIKPNPNIAPIVQAPFYAFEIYPGDLDTKGGLKANEHGQVLQESGEPIAGLYATGNSSGAAMGNSYPGAGSTIGPAMAFGYMAACHANGVIPSGER